MHSDASGDAGRGVVGVSKPATVEQCHAVIDALAGELASLRDKVIILEERLALDSRNSSKPPSSDGPGRGNRAQRRASARKRGAQKGHPGAFRALLPESEVHRVQDCVPPPVCTCGGTVSVRGRPERHQVFDIPPMRPEVSEYRLYSGVCAGCGGVVQAALPPGVPRGQIGPRALAIIGVLGTRYQMTQLKIRNLLAQLTGLDFSMGRSRPRTARWRRRWARRWTKPRAAWVRRRWCTWTRRAMGARAAAATGCGRRSSSVWPSTPCCLRGHATSSTT